MSSGCQCVRGKGVDVTPELLSGTVYLHSEGTLSAAKGLGHLLVWSVLHKQLDDLPALFAELVHTLEEVLIELISESLLVCSKGVVFKNRCVVDINCVVIIEVLVDCVELLEIPSLCCEAVSETVLANSVDPSCKVASRVEVRLLVTHLDVGVLNEVFDLLVGENLAELSRHLDDVVLYEIVEACTEKFNILCLVCACKSLVHHSANQ